ncbi:MAG: hypothetical protein M3Q55_17905 [Acidobacteriota bacterium]|nr:hypothetical protein [Acidobacteriota bacterium]
MRRLSIPCVALALAAGSSPATAVDARALPQQEVIAVAAFVSASSDYLRQYQDELTAVVADETYVQQVRLQIPRDGARPLRTTLSSEVFFMFTEGFDWMAIRDVVAVDGKPLEKRPDLRVALRDLPAPQVASRFKAYNSRFNVGRVRRNFNEPTISLLALDDRHRARFAFTRARARRGDDPRFVTLVYRERQEPTLVRGLSGGPVFASGELTLEPVTGRITRATLALTMDTVRVVLDTRYEVNANLGIAVPVRFTEHYTDGPMPKANQPARPGARHEDITCEATYSNFQRFEVKTRIR